VCAIGSQLRELGAAAYICLAPITDGLSSFGAGMVVWPSR